MPSKSFREQAIVLRSYNLGEADRIVVMLGKTEGQVRAVAKGIRRTSSRFGARLASFNLVDVQCHRSTSGLHTVMQVETLRPYSALLARDYQGYAAVKAIGEVAVRLTDNQVETLLRQYSLLEGAIHALAYRRRPATLVAASYMLRAIAIEGWAPHLGSCAVCSTGHVIQRGLALFDAELGGQVCENCAPIGAHGIDPRVLELMSALLEPAWERALGFPEATWVPACDLAAAWAEWHLEHRLYARAFLRQTLRMG